MPEKIVTSWTGDGATTCRQIIRGSSVSFTNFENLQGLKLFDHHVETVIYNSVVSSFHSEIHKFLNGTVGMFWSATCPPCSSARFCSSVPGMSSWFYNVGHMEPTFILSGSDQWISCVWQWKEVWLHIAISELCVFLPVKGILLH